MPTKQINDESFDAELLNSDKLVLVDFWAEWCGPCKQIAPILEEISLEYEDKIHIIKINIDENPITPSKYGIRGIPTLLLFKKLELVSTKVGSYPKSKIVEWIEETI
jgi:thioredoxin 1